MCHKSYNTPSTVSVREHPAAFVFLAFAFSWINPPTSTACCLPQPFFSSTWTMSKSRSCVINSELNAQQQSLRSSACTLGHSVGRSSVTGTVSHGCICCFLLIENQQWGLLFLLSHSTFGAIRLLIHKKMHTHLSFSLNRTFVLIPDIWRKSFFSIFYRLFDGQLWPDWGHLQYFSFLEFHFICFRLRTLCHPSFLDHLSWSIHPWETIAGLRPDNISTTVLRPSRWRTTGIKNEFQATISNSTSVKPHDIPTKRQDNSTMRSMTTWYCGFNQKNQKNLIIYGKKLSQQADKSFFLFNGQKKKKKKSMFSRWFTVQMSSIDSDQLSSCICRIISWLAPTK